MAFYYGGSTVDEVKDILIPIDEVGFFDKYDPRGWYVWGLGFYGGLGLGDTINRSSPVMLVKNRTDDWAQVNNGGYSIGVVKTNGTLWTWGLNDGGQLGHNDTINRSSPSQVGTLTDWKYISISNEFAAAIKKDGTLWTWGFNGATKKLGDYTTANRSSPVIISALTDWKSICVNGMGAVAHKIDGSIWSWGANVSGDTGLGNTLSVSSPTRIGSLNNWTKIINGSTEASGGIEAYSIGAALKDDGSLWTWGTGAQGALGLITTVSRSTPTQVGTTTFDWKDVSVSQSHNTAAAGYGHVAAIKYDGTLWTWGPGGSGQLGLNTTVNRSSPTQVGLSTEHNWLKVSCGISFTSAIKTDGTLWTWGYGGDGAGGDGITTYRSSPVQVGIANTWFATYSGGVMNIAKRV